MQVISAGIFTGSMKTVPPTYHVPTLRCPVLARKRIVREESAGRTDAQQGTVEYASRVKPAWPVNAVFPIVQENSAEKMVAVASADCVSKGNHVRAQASAVRPKTAERKNVA
jgi:hypothetical protein